MAKGIFRVRSIRANGITSSERHNMRLYPPDKMPNVNPELTYKNLTAIADERSSVREVLNENLQGVTVRKNSVVIIEFVMGASSDFFNKNYDTHGYLSKCMDFIASRHGRHNLVAYYMHFDESNPHVHLFITPIQEKTVRWKNQKGEGVKKERRLCARDIVGGKAKLRAMQQDFYEFIRPMGIIAGAEFEPRILVEDQMKAYSRDTDYRIAEMRKLAEQARLEVDAAKRLELQKQILLHNEALEKLLQKKNEEEKKIALSKRLNKNINKSR